MSAPLSDPTLDAILALQITIAWAGEGRCTPKRLGWWDTDLVDEMGGGDLLRRLLPKTGVWAALEAVREAARRTDAKARAQMADADRLRTLFFLGFEIDEQLSDRLALLKRSGRSPAEALPFPLELSASFAADKLEALLRQSTATFTTMPTGRQVKGKMPEAPDALVRQLAAALVPFAPQYPLPYFKTET